MLKILDKIILIISILSITGLIGSYMASYINPNSFVIPSLLGLGYPYLLITNILLLLYWSSRIKKMAWVMLGTIILGIPAFMTYYGTAKKEKEEQKHDLSLLSYNVRYFDVYDWSQKKDTRQKLFDYLNQFEGDIICLQEFSMNSNNANNRPIINKLLSYPYYHINKDMAIFSRFPINAKGSIPSSGKYACPGIYIDVTVAGKKVRLFSVHLESYKLGKEEHKFVKEISSEGFKSSNITDGLKNITGRLTRANKARARQAEQIKAYILRSPYPVVVCGDFNDTPLSYTYKTLKGDFTDAFIEKGRGLGNTYIGEFPSFRIDYILHSPELSTVSYSRNKITLSDHYPIIGKLKVNPEK